MSAPDADREHARLAELDARPFPSRLAGYVGMMGPGYLQSAMTLGGGSAFAAIFAGAAFGYRLLWVAPLGMLLGIIVMSAVAWQTLSTGMNPYQALRTYAHPFFAWAFAWGGLLSSVIWQFAQYALASAMLVMLARELGWHVEQWVMGLVALAWCVAVTMLYGRQRRFVRIYENVLKAMVWLIVACFAIVVVRSGIPNPLEMVRGFVPSIPGEERDVVGLKLIASGLAAAVGANMLFVYPYTLMRNGWGRPHRRLARYDLFCGMFLPFALAVSMIVIASAAVFHYGDPELFTGRTIPPPVAAEVFADPERLGDVVGIWVFGLGIIAMALSSITMQMVAAGFASCELFGWKVDSPAHKAGMMLPAVGVLGSVYWTNMSLWVPVPTNIICGLLLPVSYLGFVILQRNRRYLGDDRPSGLFGAIWIAGMVLAMLVLVVFLASSLSLDLPDLIDRIVGAPAVAGVWR